LAWPWSRGGGAHHAHGGGHSHGHGSTGHERFDDESLTAVSDDKPEGERERLIWAMEKCGWVQAKAARLLNITPRQMGYALQKYDIEVRKF